MSKLPQYPQIVRMPEDEGFGWILELAGEHGWIDKHGDAQAGSWSPREADDCEQDALDYLASKGIGVMQDGEILNGSL